MNLKKKKLALALAAIFTTGSASAVIDMPDNTGAIDFDNSIVVPTTINTSNSSILQAETKLGFSITSASAKYIRFDIIGTAKWGQVVTAADLIGGIPTSDVVVSQGGAVGDNFVIFEINATADYDQNLYVSLAGLAIKVADQEENQISYGLYQSALDAQTQANAISSQQAKYFGWKQAYEVSCLPGNPHDIDVAKPWLFVDNTYYSGYIFDATVRVLNNIYNKAGDATVQNDDYFSTGTTLTVNGHFEGSDGAYLYNYLTVADDDQSASWTSNPGNFTERDFYFYALEDPAIPMIPGDYSMTLDAVGNEVDLDPIDLGVCGSLKYSGSRDRMDFGLTPNGNFQMWIRVTNPSETTGPVVVQVWNDAGDSSTFDLGDIAGVPSNDISAGGSTAILDINDVYAAAQAADPTFDIGAVGGKLRVEVRGGFGQDATESSYGGAELAGRAEDGIHIVALTISKDGNSFFVTNP